MFLKDCAAVNVVQFLLDSYPLIDQFFQLTQFAISRPLILSDLPYSLYLYDCPPSLRLFHDIFFEKVIVFLLYGIYTLMSIQMR